MNWPDDFINKIICGDCLEIMKEMPSRSVDMIMTSPPYWGLRDYGIEQIFGGDRDCEHEWGDRNYIKPATQVDFSKSGLKKDGRTEENRIKTNIKSSGKRSNNPSDSQLCLKCQAWKGQLGLEPTPEMYIEHLTIIFNEAKRVLKKEGSLWLNIGDTYNAQPAGNKEPNQFMSQVHQSARENKNDPKRSSSISKFKRTPRMVTNPEWLDTKE